MSFDVRNSVHSAFASGQLGLQRAQQGITDAAVNIAQQNRRATSPTEVLENAATQQLSAVKQVLPPVEDNLTSNLISLQVNSNNALASAKVLDVADKTVGRIIDELA